MTGFKLRRFVVAGLAAVSLAALGTGLNVGAPAIAAEKATARAATNIGLPTVQPVAANKYRISWGATASPFDIYVASSPDAAADDRQLLARGVVGTDAEVTVNSKVRPYFYLQPRGEKNASGIWVAERLLPLEGGRNFRDMGGYVTEDGRTVKWGQVFRSGAMAGLTEADQQYLAHLGIRQVCDFRTTSERGQENAKWLQNNEKIAYWVRDYQLTDADFGRVMSGNLTPEQARASMINLYDGLPYEQKTAYTDMFRFLADGQIPLAFNCTAGKDRAGFAAALILTAVGVPQETVFADYALTNVYLPLAYSPERQTKDGNNEMAALLAKVSKETIAALMVADPEYLRTAFAAIERKNGSMDNYFRDELGLSEEDRETLKNRLLR